MGLYTAFEKSYDKKISAKGISLLRIFYAALLISGAIHNLYFLRLLSDPIPFVETSLIDLRYAYILWIIVLFFLLIGYKTRYMAIANYVLMVALLSSLTTFQYHFDYASINLGLFLVFISSNQTYSIDRLLEKLKNPLAPPPNPEIRQLYVFLILFFCLGIVYASSMPNKLTSTMYLQGLGVWLPGSIPQNVYLNLSPILNLKWFMIGLGYMVLIYETLFPFLFFKKKFRIPLLIVGFGLHFGITFAYPIPKFGLVCLFTLILLVPLKWFEFNFKFNFLKRFRVSIYYDRGCKICNATKVTFEHFDFFKLLKFIPIQTLDDKHYLIEKIGRDQLLRSMYSTNEKGKIKDGVSSYARILFRNWFLFPLGLLCVLPPFKQIGKKIYAYISKNRYISCHDGFCELNQITVTEATIEDKNKGELLIFKRGKVLGILTISFFLVFVQFFYFVKDDYAGELLTKKLGLEKSVQALQKNQIADSFGRFFNKLTGMNAHGVFLYERHFKNYDHLVAVTYLDQKTNKETWIPLYRDNGMVNSYNFGRYWLKWNFRSNSRNCNNEELASGLKLFTAFWAGKNNISLDDARFNIKVKVYDPINGWEYDYLEKQLNKEWIDAGYIEFKNNTFHYENMKEIESIQTK